MLTVDMAGTHCTDASMVMHDGYDYDTLTLSQGDSYISLDKFQVELMLQLLTFKKRVDGGLSKNL